jgi:hypothetical protein
LEPNQLYTKDDVRQWQNQPITKALRILLEDRLQDIRKGYYATDKFEHQKGMEEATLKFIDMIDSDILEFAG